MTTTEAAVLTGQAELTRKRRAVYTALAPHLAPRQLFTALWLWEEEFSHGPTMALQGFLDRLGKRLGTNSPRRRYLHRSLVDALGRPETELAADPMPQMLEFSAGRLPSEQDRTAAPYLRYDPVPLRVFSRLMSSFIQALGRHDRSASEKLAGYVAQQLPRLALAPAELAELGQWLNRVRPALSRPLPEATLRAIVHAAYVGACEYFGPVLTDRCLAEALAAAAALAEARHCDPRRLL